MRKTDNIREGEPGVAEKHVTIQRRDESYDFQNSDDPLFEAYFHHFGQYNGRLVAAQVMLVYAHKSCENIKIIAEKWHFSKISNFKDL